MSSGGKSTKINNFFFKMLEDYKIINKHELGGFFVLLRKIFSKIKQIKQFYTYEKLFIITKKNLLKPNR